MDMKPFLLNEMKRKGCFASFIDDYFSNYLIVSTLIFSSLMA